MSDTALDSDYLWSLFIVGETMFWGSILTNVDFLLAIPVRMG